AGDHPAPACIDAGSVQREFANLSCVHRKAAQTTQIGSSLARCGKGKNRYNNLTMNEPTLPLGHLLQGDCV
ncbi:MAG: hypothetical protein Q8O57_08915, partial [Kiritimatiellota bacterium]|nr:hypothetical protein [Kiritimatiellota bacterium]